MTDALDILLQASFWAATLRIATPLIFATLGELLCERAGTLNLGIEGIMTLGAMVGWLAVYQGADLWTGVLLAALAGMAMGLLLGLLTVPLGLSQHVTGIGITLLAYQHGLLRLPRAAAQRQHAADRSSRSRPSPEPGSPTCRCSARCWRSRPC